MSWSLPQFRSTAIAHTLFQPTTLSEAFSKLGFVQADPIRSPARAQDLILRHRVSGYSQGDLEQQYPDLELEEDLLYAYGFIRRDLWKYLYPRKDSSLSSLDHEILAHAKTRQVPLEVKELEQLFGRARVINAWGGHSQATKNALENLHYAGYLRIRGRAKGRRIYLHTSHSFEELSEQQRLRQLILAVVGILTPVHERTLQEALARVRRSVGETKHVLTTLLQSGELECLVFNGQSYILLPGMANQDFEHEGVKFLAPFDPLVWDRRRFEQLWGWPYRFEAYTPAAKRVRGYYALPLLWRESIVGWANVSVTLGALTIETGFVEKPNDPQFEKALHAETERIAQFLKLPAVSQ